MSCVVVHLCPGYRSRCPRHPHTRGKYLAATVTFASSLERPAPITEREVPIYFYMDFFL